jgi:hypothetical protein
MPGLKDQTVSSHWDLRVFDVRALCLDVLHAFSLLVCQLVSKRPDAVPQKSPFIGAVTLVPQPPSCERLWVGCCVDAGAVSGDTRPVRTQTRATCGGSHLSLVPWARRRPRPPLRTRTPSQRACPTATLSMFLDQFMA